MNFLSMRPFQIIFIVVFGLLALVGLYLFANYSSFSGTHSVGTVVIWGTLPQHSIEDTINTFKATQPQYARVSYVQKPAPTFDTDLAEAIASGVGPDLVIINQEQYLAEAPKLSFIPFSSISERTYKDTFVPIDEIYLTDKGTYAIPLVVDPLVLYTNRTTLDSAGIAQPPTTWEAVSGMVPTLVQKTANGTITRAAIALGEYSNVTNARAIVSLLFFQAGLPITENTASGLRSTLSHAASSVYGQSPGQSAMNFYTQFADPAKTVYSWNRSLPESRQLFLSGDLAFYVGYASEELYLKAANPNLNFDMTAMPQPASLDHRVTYGLAYAFAIPKASRNASGAFQVATAFADKKVNMSVASALGMAPAVRSALTAAPNDPYAAIAYPEALVAKAWLSPAPASTDPVFAAMIDDITSGRKSVENAIFTTDEALNAALQ